MRRPHGFRAILFDLDGVLVDSYDCWWHLLQDARREQGKNPVTRKDFDAAWGQGPDQDQKMFFPEWTVSELVRYYDSNFMRYTKWVKPEPAAQEVLRALHQDNKLIGVASNSTPKVIETLLREASLDGSVDAFSGADETIKGKPAPDLIFHVLQKLNIESADVCYVGDSVFDKRAARAANVFFVGYKRQGDRKIQRLEDLLPLARGQ